MLILGAHPDFHDASAAVFDDHRPNTPSMRVDEKPSEVI
jgi:hypothetical protein